MAKISLAEAKAFWEKLDQMPKKSNRPSFVKHKPLKPFSVLGKVVGTVKSFPTIHQLREHLRLVNAINKLGKKTSFESFEFVPLQILGIDRKNCRTLERAFMRPTMANIVYRSSPGLGLKDNLYGETFEKRMKLKGVKLEEVEESLRKAHAEIREKIFSEINFDFRESNIIVVDYDKQTKKPLLAIIDPADKTSQ